MPERWAVGFGQSVNVEWGREKAEWRVARFEWKRKRRRKSEEVGSGSRLPAEGGGEGCSASRQGETVNRTSSSPRSQPPRRRPMSRSLRGGGGGMGFLPRKPSPRNLLL